MNPDIYFMNGLEVEKELNRLKECPEIYTAKKVIRNINQEEILDETSYN